jgi:putative transposase
LEQTLPYEYRKMTPEERDRVLRQRRERGYPLHDPPHPFREGGRYLLTAANFEHVPVMAASDRRTDFETRLTEGMCAIHADVFGWVILPNHYHILVGVESLDDVSPVLKQLHGTTSREWNLADNQTGKRRVWYKFTDRMIRNDAHFYRALNYIHYNPVKHRYTDDPYEWPWSSLHNYLEADGYGREWLRVKWQVHPPGDFGKGWDD